jgi:hypothetical protein
MVYLGLNFPFFAYFFNPKPDILKNYPKTDPTFYLNPKLTRRIFENPTRHLDSTRRNPYI